MWSGQIASLANWMEVYLFIYLFIFYFLFFFFLGSSIRLQEIPRDGKICKKYQKIRFGARKCLLGVRSFYFNIMISKLAKNREIWLSNLTLKIFAKKLILRVTTFLLVMLFKFRPYYLLYRFFYLKKLIEPFFWSYHWRKVGFSHKSGKSLYK